MHRQCVNSGALCGDTHLYHKFVIAKSFDREVYYCPSSELPKHLIHPDNAFVLKTIDPNATTVGD